MTRLNRAMWMMERGYKAKSAYLVYLYARRMGYFEMAEDARQSVHELIFRIRDGMKPTTLMGILPEEGYPKRRAYFRPTFFFSDLGSPFCFIHNRHVVIRFVLSGAISTN